MLMLALQVTQEPGGYSTLVNYGAPLFILIWLGEKTFGLLRRWLDKGNGNENGSDTAKKLEQLETMHTALYTIVGNLQVSVASLTSAVDRGVLPRLDDFVERLREVERRP